MSNYRAIYTLRITHDYYSNSICRAIQIRTSSSAHTLMKRRGIAVKQVEVNEWQIIGDCEGGGVDDNSDVLTLEMTLAEPHFMYFTQWKKFNPEYAYTLNLPINNTTIGDAADIIINSNKERTSDAFCTINIKLSNAMFQKAKEHNSLKNTVHFTSSKAYWEYILISRNDNYDKKISIIERDEKIEFSEMERVNLEPFQHQVNRTISKSDIPMREEYEYHLELIETIRENPPMKRIVTRQLHHPEIGRHITEKTNIIRQIHYY